MQRIFIAALLFITASCGSNDQEEVSTKPKEENWVLDTKVRWEYKLNNVGNFDTTFISTQKYKEGLVADSASMFVVSRYKGNVYDEITYSLDSTKQSFEQMTTRSVYDKDRKPLSKRVIVAGKLITDEQFIYNDSNLLAKSVKIQAKLANKPEAGRINVESSDIIIIGYDTLISIFEYDPGKKVIATKFTNSAGTVLSRDVNLYSGNDPLLTVSINPQGDTLKRITYEKNKDILMTVMETDSIILAQNFLHGRQVAQRTKYKSKNEQWRTAIKFDENGRKVEENLYKLM